MCVQLALVSFQQWDLDTCLEGSVNIGGGGGLKGVYLNAVLHAEHCNRAVGIRVEVC